MTGGLQSSAYERGVITVDVTIAADTKILSKDLGIAASTLRGSSGLVRIFWSFTTGTDYILTITKKGAAFLLDFPLIVNGDNGFVLKSDGYYRFDVGIKPGDLINLSSSVDITKINDLQIQQIQIGA